MRSRGGRRRAAAARACRKSQKRLAAWTTAAHDQPLAVGVVVIGELFAFADLPRRANPDDAVLDVDITIGPARVIDEARVVAADRRIDDRALRERKTPDVTL